MRVAITVKDLGKLRPWKDISIYSFVLRRRTKISRAIDVTGHRFGRLVVLEMLYNYIGKQTYCKCICDCGNYKIVNSYGIRTGNVSSCGCLRKEVTANKNKSDETGKKFNRLTIIEIIRDDGKRATAKCLCDCGKEIITSKSDVVTGHTQSCGCFQQDRVRETSDVDSTGFVSDYGVEIINKSHRNKNNVWVWNCKCSCGNEFKAVPARIKNGHITSCGCNRQSSRERYIDFILNENNINFLPQYRFKDCKNKYTLPFDFSIFDRNNKLLFLIEYQGKQHYIPVEHWGGVNGFEYRKNNDKIKFDYCVKNNIPIIILKYTLKNDEIKEQIINTYKSLTTAGD